MFFDIWLKEYNLKYTYQWYQILFASNGNLKWNDFFMFYAWLCSEITFTNI